jgi:hypothetical protein
MYLVVNTIMPNKTKGRHSFIVSSNPALGAVDRSANGADFSVDYPTPFYIPRNATNITVHSPLSNIWNTTLNVSAALANNTFTFSDDGTVWVTITVPNGRYSIPGLSQAINREASIVTNHAAADVFSIVGDNSTQNSTIFISKAGWQIDFPANGSIRSLLGFDAQLIPAVYNTPATPVQRVSDQNANFGDLTAFVISSSLCEGGDIVLGSRLSSVMHIAPIKSVPGFISTHESAQPFRISTPRLRGAELSRIDFRLSDQIGQTLDTNESYYLFLVVIEFEIDETLAEGG